MEFKRVDVVHHTYIKRPKNSGIDGGETWFVRLIAKNGQTLMTSETYTTKRKAMNLAKELAFQFVIDIKEIEKAEE